MSFTPDQIDDDNLDFWYTVEEHLNGLYYRVKSGAPTGFPEGFWATERQSLQQQGTTAIVPQSQAAPTYYQWVVRTFRIVAHTLGPLIQGGVLSANHWSIYLLTGDGSSVQINMRTNLNPGETRGIYEVTERAYEVSKTALQFFDFPAKDGITVGYVLDEITTQGWHRYNMTDGGVGCRCLTVMRGLVHCLGDAQSVENVLGVIIRYSWHRKNPPIALPIQKGTFL